MSDDDNITVFPAPKKRPAGPGRGHKVKQGNGFVNKPATGLPAMGEGWGGDASGTEGWKQGEVHAPLRTPERDKARAEMMDTIYTVAMTSESEALRMMAADKVLDRLIGKPMQTNLNLNRDDISQMSADELRDELAKLSGT